VRIGHRIRICSSLHKRPSRMLPLTRPQSTRVQAAITNHNLLRQRTRPGHCQQNSYSPTIQSHPYPIQLDQRQSRPGPVHNRTHARKNYRRRLSNQNSSTTQTRTVYGSPNASTFSPQTLIFQQNTHTLTFPERVC